MLVFISLNIVWFWTFHDKLDTMVLTGDEDKMKNYNIIDTFCLKFLQEKKTALSTHGSLWSWFFFTVIRETLRKLGKSTRKSYHFHLGCQDKTKDTCNKRQLRIKLCLWKIRVYVAEIFRFLLSFMK